MCGGPGARLARPPPLMTSVARRRLAPGPLARSRERLDEVSREVDANAALTSEVLEQRYPGLVRVLRAP